MRQVIYCPNLAGAYTLSITEMEDAISEASVPLPADDVISLDEQETRILRARGQGLKWHEMGDELHMDRAEVDRLRKRIERKGSTAFWREQRGSSTHLSFCERTHDGKTFWSLARLDDLFIEVMREEKKMLFCPKPGGFGGEG